MKDEDINKVVKENEIQAEGWVFSNLSELLYDWFDRFNERFFENNLKTPAISFEKTRKNSLGHFVIGRNAYGDSVRTSVYEHVRPHASRYRPGPRTAERRNAGDAVLAPAGHHRASEPTPDAEGTRLRKPE